MSIFWLGGKEEIFPSEELEPMRGRIRYFRPGIIHGCEEHLIRVSLNEDRGEGYPEEFEVEYLWRDDILAAANEDPTLTDKFWDYLQEHAENFGAENDGTGDFYSLCEEWPKSVAMTAQELVRWAKKLETI